MGDSYKDISRHFSGINGCLKILRISLRHFKKQETFLRHLGHFSETKKSLHYREFQRVSVETLKMVLEGAKLG